MLVSLPVSALKPTHRHPNMQKERYLSTEARRLQSTYWRSVPDVKSSVIKLTVIVLLSSQES